MAELAVRAKYESVTVPTVRTLLKATFPIWGIICPAVAIIGTVIVIFGMTVYQSIQAAQISEILKICAGLASAFAISMIGLTATRLFAKNEIIVDKSGIRLPILPEQPQASTSFYSWSQLTKLDVAFADKPWKDRQLLIFNNRHAPIRLEGTTVLTSDEAEQILLAVELWSDGCQMGDNVGALRSDIKQLASGRNDLSYTDMWEEELRRRYCPTNFIPLGTRKNAQQWHCENRTTPRARRSGCGLSSGQKRWCRTGRN